MNNLSRTLVLCSALILTACAEDDPQQFIEEGKALFEKGEEEGARVQFKNALQVNPRLAEAYYGLAMLDKKAKDWHAMRKNLIETVALDPGHLDAHVGLGHLLFDQMDKAKEHSSIALKINPDYAGAILLDASIKYHEGDKGEARKQVDQVLAKDPGSPDAIRLLVTMLSDDKHLEEALLVLDRGIQAHPDDLDLYLLKIRKLTDLKRDDEVNREYANLVKKFPEDNALRRTQIEFLVRSGRDELVEKALREAILNAPADLNYKLALIGHVGHIDNNRVELLLKEYIKEFPGEMRFKFRLAGFYLRKQDTVASQAIYKDILDADPRGKDGFAAKIRLAEIAVEQKEKVLAERLVGEVLSADGSNSDALLIRAKMRLDRREADKAISDLRIVLRDRPNSDQAMLMMARASVLNKEPEVAEQYWKKAVEANPRNLKAVVPLVLALLKRGDDVRAEELVVGSIKVNPGNTALVEVLVKLRVEKKDWAGAESAINDLELLPNGDLSAKMLTAMIAENQGRQIDAIQVYKGILNKQPNSNRALNAIARSYAKLGRNAEFISYMQNFIKESPGSIFGYSILGQAYATDNNWNDANKVLQKVLDLEPKTVSAYRLLSSVLIRQGKVGEVAELYNRGLAVLPGNQILLMELARHYELLKENDKAISIYERVVAKYPGNEEASNNLAYLLVSYAANSAKIKQALALVERHKNSNSPFFQDTYGWVLFKVGDAEKAIIVLKKAVATIPNNAVFRYHLGEAYYAQNNYNESKIELEKSLSLVENNSGFAEIERIRLLLKEINDLAREGS